MNPVRTHSKFLPLLMMMLMLSCFTASKSALACSSEPLLGSMCVFAGNFAPRGYMMAHGQLLPISQHTALFSLLGTTYGGDGRTTFALPDTRGRVMMGAGSGPGLQSYLLGQKGGVETVTLTSSQVPTHSHNNAKGSSLTQKPSASEANTGLSQGGASAHENRMPYLAVHWIIAVQGLYPARQ